MFRLSFCITEFVVVVLVVVVLVVALDIVVVARLLLISLRSAVKTTQAGSLSDRRSGFKTRHDSPGVCSGRMGTCTVHVFLAALRLSPVSTSPATLHTHT